MSSGEKNVEELKRLVVHTLETNGVLGQIRAELRSNVYKVIDEDETRTAPTHRPAAKLMNSPMGCLMAEIVAEFFEFYEFRHSLSVFMPESNLGRNERRSRDQVALDAGLDPRAARLADASILEQLVASATGSSELRKGGDCRGDDWHSSASSTTASSPPPAAPMTAASRLHPTVDSSAATVPKTDSDASPRGGKLSDSHVSVMAGYPGGSAAPGATGPSSGTAAAPLASSPTASEDHEEASPAEEGTPEEAAGKSRKPRRKQLLPSLSGPKDFLNSANPASPGQLPPLKVPVSPPSLSGASDRGGPEEVSLSESSVGVSRESCEEVRDEVLRLDRRLARIPGRPNGTGIGAAVPSLGSGVVTAANREGATSSNGDSPVASPVAGSLGNASGSIHSFSGEKAPEVSANDISIMSAASHTSAVSAGIQGSGPTRTLARSANSSPANSSGMAESPLRSPPLSPGSHHASSASASQTSPVAATPNGSLSQGASPRSNGSAVRSEHLSVPEDAAAQQNDSISIDESSGDGDIDLALGGTERSTVLSSKPLGVTTSAGGAVRAGALFPSTTTATAPFVDEEVDESIDEDVSNHSHESFQSSEDPWKNQGDDAF